MKKRLFEAIHSIAIIAIAAVIGFAALSLAGCDNDTISDTDGFVAVTGITGIPSGKQTDVPLTLNGTVVPADATNKTIVWSIAEDDEGDAEPSLDGNVLSTASEGSVKLTATIVNGLTASSNYTQNFTITVTDQPPDPCECEGVKDSCGCGEDCECGLCETTTPDPCECEGVEEDCGCGEDCECGLCGTTTPDPCECEGVEDSCGCGEDCECEGSVSIPKTIEIVNAPVFTYDMETQTYPPYTGSVNEVSCFDGIVSGSIVNGILNLFIDVPSPEHFETFEASGIYSYMDVPSGLKLYGITVVYSSEEDGEQTMTGGLYFPVTDINGKNLMLTIARPEMLGHGGVLFLYSTGSGEITGQGYFETGINVQEGWNFIELDFEDPPKNIGMPEDGDNYKWYIWER